MTLIGACGSMWVSVSLCGYMYDVCSAIAKAQLKPPRYGNGGSPLPSMSPVVHNVCLCTRYIYTYISIRQKRNCFAHANLGQLQHGEDTTESEWGEFRFTMAPPVRLLETSCQKFFGGL